MNESYSFNVSFIDATRDGTLIGNEKKKQKRQLLRNDQDDLSNDDSNENSFKPDDYNDIYEGEWFMDAEDDEELTDMMLEKHGFKRIKTDAVLQCPACFAILCNWSQQHEVYHDQFRALIVTSDVRVSKQDLRPWKAPDGICIEYWAVFCRLCQVEVGVYDPGDEMYHFHDVLPSR